MPAAAKPRAKTPVRGTSKKGAARKRAASGVSLPGALAEAAWVEADHALAEALAASDEAEAAKTDQDRDDALALLTQALTRAARKRGLSRIGQMGAREPYDPKRHDLDDGGARAPKTVRVSARGVSRGGETLVKPRVKRLRRAKAPS